MSDFSNISIVAHNISAMFDNEYRFTDKLTIIATYINRTTKPSSSNSIPLTNFPFPYNQALSSRQDAKKSDHDLNEPYDTFHEQLHSQLPCCGAIASFQLNVSCKFESQVPHVRLLSVIRIERGFVLKLL